MDLPQRESMNDPVINMDKKLRQMIAEYFFLLEKMNDPQKGVKMLAEHVAIMVEMINELKSK